MNKELNKKEQKKVLAVWDQKFDKSVVDVYSFPPVRDYFFQLVSCTSGKTNEKEYLEKWFIETYLKDLVPVENCLSICCGEGRRDRRLAKLNAFQNCLGLDISQTALDFARREAAADGYDNLEYKYADLNKDKLGYEKYDLIYAFGAMHHISNLEHLVAEIHNSLKPGGYFICDEYIGPAYNNLSNRHREIINSAIHLLPERLRYIDEDKFIPVFWRRSLFRAMVYALFHLNKIDFDMYPVSPNWPRYKKWIFNYGRKLSRIFPQNTTGKRAFRYGKVFDICPRHIKHTDPSEGVRSDEIIPVLKQQFNDIDVRYYNGSVVSYALDKKCFKNYDPSSAEDRALINILLNIDKEMCDSGEIPAIHAVIVAKKI